MPRRHSRYSQPEPASIAREPVGGSIEVFDDAGKRWTVRDFRRTSDTREVQELWPVGHPQSEHRIFVHWKERILYTFLDEQDSRRFDRVTLLEQMARGKCLGPRKA